MRKQGLGIRWTLTWIFSDEWFIGHAPRLHYFRSSRLWGFGCLSFVGVAREGNMKGGAELVNNWLQLTSTKNTDYTFNCVLSNDSHLILSKFTYCCQSIKRYWYLLEKCLLLKWYQWLLQNQNHFLDPTAVFALYFSEPLSFTSSSNSHSFSPDSEFSAADREADFSALVPLFFASSENNTHRNCADAV